MAINSYSSYLAYIQNPRCPGASGATGPIGPQGYSGATGPTGPKGIDGLTTGLIYYFRTEQAGQPNNQPVQGNVGPTGFSMNVTQYSSGTALYSFIVGPTGSTGSTLADFRLPFTQTTPMPAGNWVFTQDLDSFNTTNGANISTTISPFINQISGGTTTLLGGSPSRFFQVNSSTGQDSNGYTVSIPVKNTTFLNGDFLQVIFKLDESLITNQQVQFWTEGDTISQVVTTFSPQSGPTGYTGPPGTNGINGTNGATGPTGPGGPVGTISGTPNQLAFYGTGGSLTGSSTFAVNTNPSANAIVLLSPSGGVDTGVNFGVPSASGSITFNGTNLRLVYNGTDKLYANGSLVTIPGNFQVTGTSFLSGPTQTQQVQSTSITSTGNVTAQSGFLQPLSNGIWSDGQTLTVTTDAGSAAVAMTAGSTFVLTNNSWTTSGQQCLLFVQQVVPEIGNLAFQYIITPSPPHSFTISKTASDGTAKAVYWFVIRSV